MGFARIISGGEGGRYTVALDWGQATKDAVLAALSVQLAGLQVQLGQAQAKLETQDDRVTALNVRIQAEIAAIVARQNTLPAGTPEGRDDRVLRPLLEEARALQIARAPLRFNVERIKFEIAKCQKSIAYWNNFDAEETREVWCTDLTEDKAAGTYAATMDIPGDSSLLVLAPGARTPTDADGQLVARQMMAPHQAFFNAAILPGWAKFKPTYRWGTIVGLNFDADTADVQLATATLTQQGLDVNQAQLLTGVPVAYMTCDCRAFRIDDRVVVAFDGQDWASPRVVGFLDNPRGCHELAYSISVEHSKPSVSETWFTDPNYGYSDSGTIWDSEFVPGYTATAPSQPHAWLGWSIRWLSGETADQYTYQYARALASAEWLHEDHPFTQFFAVAHYYTPSACHAYVVQTELSRTTTGTPPDQFVYGTYRVQVYVHGAPGGTTTGYLYLYESTNDAASVPVGEFDDPDEMSIPNVVFDPSDWYPSFTRVVSGTLNGALPYSVTVTYEPWTATTWKPASVSPLEAA